MWCGGNYRIFRFFTFRSIDHIELPITVKIQVKIFHFFISSRIIIAIFIVDLDHIELPITVKIQVKIFPFLQVITNHNCNLYCLCI